LDIDSWKTGVERLTIHGYERTSVEVGNQVSEEPMPGAEGGVSGEVFTSKKEGTPLNNAKDPMSLTKDQMDNSVAVRFTNVDKISFTFEASAARSILFTGKVCKDCGTAAAQQVGVDGNPLVKSACSTGPSADCELGQWGVWSQCSTSCGGGQQFKTRAIVKEATNGGKMCDDFLQETQSCNQQSCTQQCSPVDCEWGDWTEWSACMHCVGQKRRTRWILKEAACGGVCDLQSKSTEETDECPRWCNGGAPVMCSWATWGTWSACTATCGVGTKNRLRSLKATKVTLADEAAAGVINQDEVPTTDADLELDMQRLTERARESESRRVRELIVSFGCGCITLTAGLMVHRVVSKLMGLRMTSQYAEVTNQDLTI
jgi:hypothetical protein